LTLLSAVTNLVLLPCNLGFQLALGIAKRDLGFHLRWASPTTNKEAISSKNMTDWVAAMNEEVHSLERNQIWTLVKPPNDKKIIGCKWVFKRKVDGSNSKAFRYKARLVAKGYSQVQGVDFNDVFSPVVKHTSIQVLLS
jgi:Reverse transcriptase (RNA-dependent DNA polymerase)